MKKNDIKDLYKYALRLLKIRMRSENELRKKLLSKKFDKESVEKIIEKLKNLGMVDDKKFVEIYIDSQIKKIKNIKLIIRELENEFMIDKNILNDINIDEFKEKLFEYAIQKIKKKYKTFDLQKIQNFLLSKGFEYSEIEKIVENLKNEKNTNYRS